MAFLGFEKARKDSDAGRDRQPMRAAGSCARPTAKRPFSGSRVIELDGLVYDPIFADDFDPPH
jgi:hypothetical protein